MILLHGCMASITFLDVDGDGFSVPQGDCDDQDPAVHPDAEEICDEIDNDCDGEIDTDSEAAQVWYIDGDMDGFGEERTSQVSCEDLTEEGWVITSSDCDDEEPDIHPGAEDLCDGLDNDCDGVPDDSYRQGWVLLSFNPNKILQIDPGTADITVLQDHNWDVDIATADVREDGTTYAAGPMLHEVDPCIPERIDIATLPSALQGVAFDSSGRLLGISADDDVLLEIDPQSGTVTEVGAVGFDIGNNGLAYDCADDLVYGIDADSRQVFEVDTSTGLAMNAVSIDITFEYVGVEYNPTTGHLWVSSGDDLYDVDPTTGNSTWIGRFDGYSLNDLALHPPCE